MRIVKEADVRKNEILDAAEILFAEKGYDDTSVTDIMNAVAIEKGTLYHHFKSKEDIMDALIERQTADILLAAKKIAEDKSIPVKERILRTIQALHVDAKQIGDKKMIEQLITFCLGFVQTLASPMILSFSDSAALGTLMTVIALGMLVSTVVLGGISIKKGYAGLLSISLCGAGICRALMSEPRIVFGDEPTGALNTKAAKEIMELFTQINNDGIAILLVTHDPNIAARTERVLFLCDGKIVNECRLSKFTEKDFDKRVAEITKIMQNIGI